MSGIILTKDRPSVSLDKRDLTDGEVVITTTWDYVPAEFDLDQGVMWRAIDGYNKSAIQALGNSFGSRDQLPFLQLDGDDRRGGTGEIIRGTYSQLLGNLAWFGVYLYNYGSSAPLEQVQGAVTTVEFPGQRPISITHEGQTGPACAILQVFNEDGAFRIQRDLQPIHAVRGQSSQQQIDTFWGVGLSWRPGSK